jgi:hypothetical protein
MEEPFIEDLLINPYYVINISPNLVDKHEPLTTKEIWVKANTRLMDEMGKEEWLKQLLHVLETGEPLPDKKKSG